MKKINCIPMLLIAVLVLCSGISELSAQPTCAGIGKCGQWGQCFDPPGCGGNIGTLTVDYQAADIIGGQQCYPGLFICVSTTIPTEWNSCSCSGANNCLYISFRNLLACSPDDPDAYNIVKIELRLHKDSNSTKWTICGPKKQWGMSPWTSMWRRLVGTTPYNSGQCNAASNWGGNTQLDVMTRPPLSGSDDDPNYYIKPLQHWTAVVCGAESIEFKVYYLNEGNTGWITPPIVGVNCPEFGNPYTW